MTWGTPRHPDDCASCGHMHGPLYVCPSYTDDRKREIETLTDKVFANYQARYARILGETRPAGNRTRETQQAHSPVRLSTEQMFTPGNEARMRCDMWVNKLEGRPEYCDCDDEDCMCEQPVAPLTRA